MRIRLAEVKDINGINVLLRQVLEVHHKGRPDLFKSGSKKYTDEQLKEILFDNNRPIFVAEDGGVILGYVFCFSIDNEGDNVLTDIKTLYIDDICVDENVRGKHVGTAIYEYVKKYAKDNNYYNITLNVWECNPGAKRFYEKLGLKPYKIGMEELL